MKNRPDKIDEVLTVERQGLRIWCFLYEWYGKESTGFLEPYARSRRGEGWMPPFITTGMQIKLRPYIDAIGSWRDIIMTGNGLSSMQRRELANEIAPSILGESGLPGVAKTKIITVEKEEIRYNVKYKYVDPPEPVTEPDNTELCRPIRFED